MKYRSTTDAGPAGDEFCGGVTADAALADHELDLAGAQIDKLTTERSDLQAQVRLPAARRPSPAARPVAS